ncbi:MAG: nucleotide exchange factor GrpE [Armatimonadota bacterium]|nr:nucleotide exchange factor GrpE [Armatimonadota bacterium]
MTDSEPRKIQIQDANESSDEPEAETDTAEHSPVPEPDEALEKLSEAAEQLQEPDDAGESTEVEEKSVEELEAEVERLRRAWEEEHDRHLRAVAELQNFKRRVARERQEQARYASQDLLSQILPVMDSLQRMLEHQAEAGSEEFARGVELIVEEFFRVIKQVGVEIIEGEGERFDPTIHEAVAQVETDEVPEGTIVTVDTPGYCLHDRCLRPARVVVAREPSDSAEEAQ